MSEATADRGPDLAQGILIGELDSGLLRGHVGDEDVLLVRAGAEIFAIGAFCSHYHGPLADGVVDGHSIRCPWHHACFDVRSGEALHAPAIAALSAYKVERSGERVIVHDKREAAPVSRRAKSDDPGQIVIIGGGAAGFAAAEMLRRKGYDGDLVMLSADKDPPVDRPNLSKDYLAGSAPEEWIPLQPDSFYAEKKIDLRLKTEVASIDPNKRSVTTVAGETLVYDRLLLATGAEPVRLTIPGAMQPNVHVLRSLSDSRAIIETAKSAKRAVVIGASFIGLEVAASLRTRGLEVHVVAPEKRPMERILGPKMGDFVRALHEEHGVNFHLGETVGRIDGNRAELSGGSTLDANFFVVGIGVRPRTALAERAGLALERGVMVNEYLETSASGIYAAGDIARWPDSRVGTPIRVEHWVVAERHGQVAALNMLGGRQKFASVPFFWSQHYDVPINYVGHAESWDDIAIDGDIPARDCALRFQSKGRVLAVASIYRDRESLEAELAMERATAT